MAGICSKHHPDRGPVPGCKACHSTPEDIFGAEEWAAMKAEAEAAGLTTCRYCGFEFYRTTHSCPACQRNAHHVWCNYFMRPLAECKMCAGMWERYPYEPGAEDGLAAKHFPDAVPVSRPGEE